MKDDQLFIDQIRDSIRKIESYTEGINKENFLVDEKTQSAVVMQLLLIGEVSKKISDNTKNKINLPWKEIIGFRDKAIHNYFDVDLNIVWQTINDDIPTLRKALA